MKEKFNSAEKAYKQIQIPEGYEKMIENTIQEAESRKKRVNRSWAKRSSIAAAVAFGVFVSTLNVNAQFANTLAQIPIIGGVAQLFTFTHKEEVTDIYELKADIPQMSDMTDSAYVAKLNSAIHDKMQGLIVEAKERAKEYKEAYLATGGKEEDFMPIQIDIDYSIKYSQDGIVSFVIDYFESFASAYNEQHFYNLDLMNNKEITLDELFEEGYEKAINEAIKAQMEERIKTEDAMYFEDFQGIAANQHFYINANGEVVIVFEKYEIAPGAMGRQEFVIKDVPMKKQYPSQVGYRVEKRTLENNKQVTYPEIVGYKGELLMDYMNQGLYSIIDKYTKPGYSNLMLDYYITRMDDTVLSVTFLGNVELEGIGMIPITESMSFDTAKTGQELTIENYIKQDEASLAKWHELMNQKAKEKGLVGFEAEGVRMCFKDSRVVFYYMPLDDAANQFVYITLTLEELESIATQEFEHIYHS